MMLIMLLIIAVVADAVVADHVDDAIFLFLGHSLTG